MVDYNRSRTVQQLLEKTASLPPSFTIHLHLEHWVLNNGSKFTYHNQIASLLDDISNCRIPVDFLELFDQAHVPFYDGCMIVELLDYRPELIREPPLRVPIKTRVVLHPNAETLWADICLMNQRLGGTMTDNDTLELESKILLATAPPLCLDPDPHLTRIVNQVIRVSTPGVPVSLKRKARAMEPEDDGPEKARRERFHSFMAPRDNRSHAPSYRLLDAHTAKRKADAAAPPSHQYANGSIAQPPQPPMHPQAPRASTPATVNTPVEKSKKKGDTPQIPNYNLAFTGSDGTHTPVPPRPTTHQFVNQHPQSMIGTPTVAPQVYSGFQVPIEATKRAPTPAQPTPQQQHTLLQQQKVMLAQQHLAQQQQAQQQQAQAAHQSQVRPPSQPQLPQQQSVQGQPQRVTQSPKPSQPIAASPPNQQPQPPAYVGTPKQFPANLPNPQFLQQPPPGIRVGQAKPQGPNGASQASPQAAPAHLQQLTAAHQLYVQQQRNIANAQQQAAGRITPQIQNQMQSHQQQQQSQQQQQAIGGAGSPSPVRASPMVSNQALQQANAVRASPVPGKNQIPAQPGQQQGPSQLPQQLNPQHQQALAQMQRTGFQQPFNPHMRSVAHGTQGSPALAAAVSNGTPSLAASVLPSPRLSGNARPITPAVNANVGGPGGVADMKMQPPQQTPQMGSMQLPGQAGQPGPMRQATPMQRQQMMSAAAAAAVQQQQQQQQHLANQQAQAQGGQPQAHQVQQQQLQQSQHQGVSQQAQMASIQAAILQQHQQASQSGAANGGMPAGVNMGAGMGMGMSATAAGGQAQGLQVPPGFQGSPAQYQYMVRMAMAHKNAGNANMPQNMPQQGMPQNAQNMTPAQVLAVRMRQMQQMQALQQQQQQQQQQQHQDGIGGGGGVGTGGMGGNMGGGMAGMGMGNMGSSQLGQGQGQGPIMVNGQQLAPHQIAYIQHQRMLAANAHNTQQFNAMGQQQQQNQAFMGQMQMAHIQAMQAKAQSQLQAKMQQQGKR